MSDAGGVASLDVLRRIQWIAVALALAGALGVAFRWGVEAAVSLTLGAAISIVSLRSLEVAVRHLRVEVDGSPGPGGTLRFRLRWWILMTVLGSTLVFGALSGTLELLALLVGLSAIPLAVLAEAAVQAFTGGVRGGSIGTSGWVEGNGSVEESDESEAR